MYFRTILIENTTNVKYILIKKRRKETHLLANLEKKGRRSSRLCVKITRWKKEKQKQIHAVDFQPEVYIMNRNESIFFSIYSSNNADGEFDYLSCSRVPEKSLTWTKKPKGQKFNFD
jgi:hypothetical protein